MDANQFNEELKYVYNVAYKLTLNRIDSEDLAQETLIKAWEKEERLRNPDARKGWLKKICLNLFYMKIRKDKNYEETFDHTTYGDDYNDYISQLRDRSPSVEREILAKEEVKIFRDHCYLGMIQNLTLNQRIIYMTVDIFGLSLSESSEILNISEAAAKAQLYRGRNRLNQFFRDKCRWLNPESLCSCEAYLESYEDIYDMQKRVKPPDDYFALSDNVPSSFDEELNKRIIEMFRTMPGFYPAEAWFNRMIGLLNEHVGK